MQNSQTPIRYTTDWQRAPKDGSVIGVEFPDGVIAHARWDAKQRHWRMPTADGAFVAMDQQRKDTPLDWWPVI